MTQTTNQHWKKRFTDFFMADEDALRMRVFECVLTFTFLVWMAKCFLTWREWLTDEGFHLTAAELSTMGYPDPWPQMRPYMVLIFGIATFGSGILLMLNRWRRACLAILFACALYAQRVDFMAAFSLSKLYILMSPV